MGIAIPKQSQKGDELAERGTQPPAGVESVEFGASVDEVRAGQILALDDRGEVIPRGRVPIRLVGRQLLVLGTWLGGAYVATGLLGTPAGGVVILVGLFAALVHTGDALRTQKVANLLTRDRREEATAALAKARSIFPWMDAYFHSSRGTLAWRNGDLGAAAAYFDTAIEKGRRWKSTSYWLCLHNRAQVAAVQGEHAAANNLLTEATRAPKSKYLVIEEHFTRLLIAFEADDPGALPDDVHVWVTSALSTSLFGGNVVLLAWLYEQRGETEMSRHLISEAPSRLDNWCLDKTMPKVHAWLEQRRSVDGSKPLE
jgi:tetratricopeptide (TPR) repeat protein